MLKMIFMLFVIVFVLPSCDDESESDTGDLAVSDSRGTPDIGGTDFSMADMDIIIDPNEVFSARSLQSKIDRVQPTTGIVLWEDDWNEENIKDDIQLEYAYFPPNKIINGKNDYDWTIFEAFLDRVAARGHQAIPRFYYTYVGRETVVPDYIKNQTSYSETQGTSEGEPTWFPDWRDQELQDATVDFLTAFAARYDSDPRIAFLQVGFGLWGEYHIYDGPNELGKDFPSHSFQKRFIEHLDRELNTLKWSISIDAGSGTLSAFPAQPQLGAADFGIFDDSFMQKEHKSENEPNWDFFDYKERFLTAPHGGEFSYFTDFDQKNVLNPNGLYGSTFEEFSKRFYISYMIGNDQPSFSYKARIKDAGMATGYKFQVIKFESSDKNTRVEIRNYGVAPIYYDAFATLSGERSRRSLKGLAPGKSAVFMIGKSSGELSISSDRLVAGQVIQFDADL